MKIQSKKTNHLFFSFLLFLILPFSTFAQDCGSAELHEIQMSKNSDYQKMFNKTEKAIYNYQKKNKANLSKSNSPKYTLPIVFHVIHLGEPVGTGSNVSDDVILEMLDITNAYFSNENGLGVDTEIQFCLATTDPDGYPTTGINRANGIGVVGYENGGVTQGTSTSSSNTDAIRDLSKWPTTDYINVHVVHRMQGGYAGTASFPSGTPYDGIYIVDNYLLSHVLTHELGHSLALYHTFRGQNTSPDCNGDPSCCPANDDCELDGDRVCDTPPHMSNECGSTLCSNENNVTNSTHNFMSYCAWSTLVLFTEGQKNRMHATIETTVRNLLLTSQGCNIPNSNNDCPDDFSGFTSIGEFGGSKYFLSNGDSQPTDAQFVAQQIGGYLAVISSQSENDFLQQNISEMTYIGLNDVASEGNLVWENGDPLNYNNINPCGFCNENSEDQDYVVMAPWDGGWSFSSVWNSRKYIVEIPCDGGGNNDLCSFSTTDSNSDFSINSIGDVSVLPDGYEAIVVSDLKVDQINYDGNGEITSTQNLPDLASIPDKSVRSKTGDFYFSMMSNGTSVKISATDYGGSILWENTFENFFPTDEGVQEIDFEILETADGVLFALKFFRLGIKLDGNGNEIWRPDFSNGNLPPNGRLTIGTQTADGGFYVKQNTNGVLYLVKLNSDGAYVWDAEAIPLLSLGDPAVIESEDGSKVYIGGNLDQVQVLVKGYNSVNGEELWVQRLQGPDGIFNYSYKNALRGMVMTTDGNLVLGATVTDFTSPIFRGALWRYFKINTENGEFIWNYQLPNAGESLFLSQAINEAFVSEPTSDGGFTLNIHLDGKFTLMKANEDGLFSPICEPNNNLPDLRIAVPRFDCGNGYLPTTLGDFVVGNSCNFAIDIYNQGLVEQTEDFDVAMYLSEDEVLDGGDMFVNSFDFSSIGFEVIEQIERTFTVPNIPSGSYYFIFKIDNDSQINESNENNNTVTSVEKYDFIKNGGGNCDVTISGLTNIGEFNGSTYYLSNENSQPVDAQLVAQQNGGYLAVISSQAENDFLQQNISEMTYIGLNDVDSEGTLIWENGDPLNYNNINPCGFCNSNSEDQDYVIMAPWDGAWSFSNVWNSRKYIVEIPCDGGPPSNEFCGFLTNYPIASDEDFRNYSIEESPTGLMLQTSTQEDVGSNSNSIFEFTEINNEGQAVGTSTLTLPVDNKSKFGDFGYRVEEVTPTQFNISAVNSSNGIIWGNMISLNVTDNNIDELISIEIKEMEDHLILSGSYHFGGGTTPTWRSFLVKLDLDGNEIWQKVFDVVDFYPNLFVHGMASDGGYYLNLDDVSDWINYLVKTDDQGNPIWTELITIVLVVEKVTFAGESPDGSGVIIGIHSADSNRADIRKLNKETGAIIWDTDLKRNPGEVGKGINGIIATSDGGAVYNSSFLDFSLLKFVYRYGRLDADGNDVWLFNLPEQLKDHQATLETSDGGFVFSNYNNDQHRIDAFKVNDDGLFDPICDVDIFSDLTLAVLRGWNGATQVNALESISFEIHNNELADAENYVVKAYLSTDNLLSPNDILVTAFGYSSTSFGIHDVTEAFQIPFVPEAEYRLILEADGNQTIAETNEDNNILTLSNKRLITGGPLLELPDLRPSFLDIGGNFGLETPPGSYDYHFDLGNIGNIEATNVSAKIFLSQDTDWSDDDIFIGEKIIGNVPVGSSSVQGEPITVTITDDIPEGLYRLILVIDADDEILEFDELNNQNTNGITVVSDVGCTTSLSGFDFIGTFENSNYFLSQNADQPTAAQTIAEDNGGYLATIKSLEENDFIFSHIDEMVYVGLNDFGMESSLEWFNGEPVSYVNFDICSFCNENSSDMDFVVMHSWNGKWSWSNFFNSRKYIVEIPCGSTLIAPNNYSVPINQTTMVEEDVSLLLQKVYPNPAQENIFTKIISPIEQDISLQIFDATGSIVLSKNVTLNNGKNVIELSTEGLPNGVYSIFIPQAKGKNATLRFVKMKN